MAHMLGPYEIRGELGRGAMAVVWHAWDARLERDVAIKEPCIAAGSDAADVSELSARFVREGRAAAGLNHPGIVTIYGADVYDGRSAIVMELIEGETLGELIRRGALGAAAALSILEQLLEAVAYAHARGVVHRDIKPDNIFITAEGRTKLTDFGLAHTGGGATLTRAGTIMGTPGYMAPEQVTGGHTDARTDVFAIGVVAYELCTGRNPFGATENVAATTVMYRIVHEPLPVMPPAICGGLPVDLSDIIMVATAKHPEARFRDAGSFLAALRGESAAEPVRFAGDTIGSPTTAAGRPGSSTRSGWLTYAMVAGAAALVLLFLFVSARGSGPSRGVLTAVAPGPEAVPVPAAADEELPPEIDLLVKPASPDIVLGETVGIEVVPSGTGSVSEVQLLVDGEVLDSMSVPPYTCAFSPSDSGSYVITARAIDAGGASWDAPATQIRVTEDVERAIREVIDQWVGSFERLDLPAHMSCYGSVVSPYFRMASATHEEVRSNKAPAFSKTYTFSDMWVDGLRVTVTGSDSAEAVFDKSWDFVSDTRFAGKVEQRLGFRRQSGGWKIVSEEELRIYWSVRE